MDQLVKCKDTREYLQLYIPIVYEDYNIYIKSEEKIEKPLLVHEVMTEQML